MMVISKQYQIFFEFLRFSIGAAEDIPESAKDADWNDMRKGNRAGTFLPQVADEVSWTKEEFLGHCAQDKAGIGWEGWRTAELYTYEAIIF